MAKRGSDKMTEKMAELLERTTRNDEKLIEAMANNQKVTESVVENLTQLNTNVVANNQYMHDNIEFIKKDLIDWIKKLTIAIVLILIALAGLKVTGLF